MSQNYDRRFSSPSAGASRPSFGGRPRQGDQTRPPAPTAGDRVVLLGRDGNPTRQKGLVRETRRVPNPFGGLGDMWARVQWDNGAGGWMAIGRTLQVIGRGEYDPNRI